MAREDEAVRRLTTIPGIGTINATAPRGRRSAMARAFRRGRDMAAWLGLTPRQMTTGGKPAPGSASASAAIAIFARNLIHGARAVLPYLVERETPLGPVGARIAWARAHKNHRRRGAGPTSWARIGLGGAGARLALMRPAGEAAA